MNKLVKVTLAISSLSLALSACGTQQLPPAALYGPQMNPMMQRGAYGAPALNAMGRQPMQGQNFQRFSAASADWHAQLPPELQQYYAPAQGKTGRDLLLALNQITQRGHSQPDYHSSKSFLYAQADNQRMGNQTGIIGIYDIVFIPGSGGNGNIYKEQGDQNRDGQAGDFINAEHIWPQSFFNKQMPMVADAHHIYPSLAVPNAMRSNHPIGMTTGVIVYQNSAGARLGVTDRTGRHNPEDIRRWYNLPYNQQPHDIMKRDLVPVFEPQDASKGNVARAMMYFFMRYSQESIFNSSTYNKQIFWDPHVRTYMQWAQLDPPDAQEQRRHGLIAQNQGNRNPFVDIPNLPQLLGEQTLLQGVR